MRIVGVDIGGFGRLRGVSLQFSRGFNLIYGENEAGKSTLLEAMQTLLFDVEDGVTGPAQTCDAFVSRYRPWDGGRFDGTLLVALANGAQFRIVRDFERGTSRIYRDPSAVDVTASYQNARRNGLNFADVHLNLTRAVFRASAWIDQADIQMAADNAAMIKDVLERLADSAGTEASVQEALNRLKGLLRERIYPQGYLAGRSPLLQAREDVERFGSELELSRRAYGALESTAIDERRMAENLADLSEQLRRLDAQLALRELTDVDNKITRLDEIDRGTSATREALRGLADVAGLTNAALQAATSALDEVDRLAWIAARTVAVVDDEREARERDEREAKALASELDDIRDISNDAIVRAESAARSWDEAARAVEKARGRVESYAYQLSSFDEVRETGTHDLPPDADPAAIGAAVRAVNDATRRARDAEEDGARVTVSAEQEAELDDLDRTLGSLTEDRLEHMLEGEDLPEPAAVRASPAIPTAIGVVVLAVFGLTASYVLFGPIGAAIGLVFGAIFGYILMPYLQSASGEGVDQDHADLKSPMVADGVESVPELRRKWNRRLELRAAVGKAHDLRRELVIRQEELSRALAELERVAGTRDVTLAVTRAEAAAQVGRDRAEVDDHVRARGDEAKRTLVELTASLERTRGAAQDLLAGVGILDSDPLDALNQLVALRLNQRRRLLVLRQQADVNGRRRAFAEHEAARATAIEELEKARRAATEWLAAVGLPAPDAGTRAELNARRDRFETYQSARDELRRWEGARTALVGREDPVEWNRRRASIRERIGDADRSDTRSLQDLHDAQQDAGRRRDETHLALSELRAQTRARLESVRPPAIVAEELAVAEARLDALTRLKRALEGAIALLPVVADQHRRDFVPRLRELVRAPLVSITAGRYDDIVVDPKDLSVQLRLDGRTDLVPLDQVSHGTRDAVGLLLRAGFVDLLGKPDEPVPLFLDDPLVHVDSDRTGRILNVLIRLAEHRQIFFVTQDPRIEEWATAHVDCQVTHLDRPS